MSCPIKDISKIFTRLFDEKSFLSTEINNFVYEFETQLKHKDREIETLFTTLQNTIEIRDTGLPRCEHLARANIVTLGAQVAETQALCRQTLAIANLPTTPDASKSQANIEATEQVTTPTSLQHNTRIASRAAREKLWQHMLADSVHTKSRIDNTFEQKDEELCEFYSDLASKLHMRN